MEKTQGKLFLGIDVGGTWIKGCVVKSSDLESFLEEAPSHISEKFYLNRAKVESPLHRQAEVVEFSRAIDKLIERLEIEKGDISGISISTAGVVDYFGACIVKSASHLSVLQNPEWKISLEKAYSCPVVLINDCDAASVGMAHLGYLKGNKAIGIMVIGTGLGFAIWKNGRRWRPNWNYPLLGSIRTPEGLFDELASASRMAALDSDGDLLNVLSQERFLSDRQFYLSRLTDILNSAAILYGLDEVCLSGGLIEAAEAVGYPLERLLNERLADCPPEMDTPLNVRTIKEGNLLQLLGAVLLAKGEREAQKRKRIPKYEMMETEIPYLEQVQLQEKSPLELVKLFSDAEREAGENLSKSLLDLAEVAEQIAARLKEGGRLIYVGAGTSGRLAAMDTVEIPCTYGLPEDKILTLIAGGAADAALDIETHFEEDASAVPEMLLLNLSKRDVVIGISASGSAYFVQSALGYAKYRGAYSVLIQNNPAPGLPFCDKVIALYSGNELVAGSTRMKAGTATKKVLNFLTSTAMILLGKVEGSYMIDVACINKKLVKRAVTILKRLHGLSKEDGLELLERNNFNLKKALESLK